MLAAPGGDKLWHGGCIGVPKAGVATRCALCCPSAVFHPCPGAICLAESHDGRAVFSVISEQPFLFVARTIFLAVLKNSFKICLLTKNAASIVRSRWVVMVVLL